MLNKNKTKSDACHTTGPSPSGYHDNAVTLCGSVLQSILKNVWRQEEISGSPDKLNLTTLLEHTKDKPQDPLISRYLAEITEASTKADSGEHLEMEEAFEMLRKVCTVSMWYLAKYPFGPTKYIWRLLSRPAPVFSLVLLFFVVATALTTSFVIRWSESTSPIAFEETYASALGGQRQVTKSNELLHESLSNYEWIQVALKEIQQENWDGAIFALSQALKRKASYKVYIMRAEQYTRKGEHEKALADCNEAVRLNPSGDRAYHVRGLIHHLMQEHQKAVQDLSKACTLGNAKACEAHKRLTKYNSLPAQSEHEDNTGRTIFAAPGFGIW